MCRLLKCWSIRLLSIAALIGVVHELTGAEQMLQCYHMLLRMSSTYMYTAATRRALESKKQYSSSTYYYLCHTFQLFWPVCLYNVHAACHVFAKLQQRLHADCKVILEVVFVHEHELHSAT